jgi:phosphopantothenoylcysteine decarboxylase/phosphopantothenate--cysteine ligase
VGFAAETRDVVDAAKGKLTSKHLDLVVANDVSVEGLGFGSNSNRVWLVSASDTVELPVMSKRSIARELWDRIGPQARAAKDRRAQSERLER